MQDQSNPFSPAPKKTPRIRLIILSIFSLIVVIGITVGALYLFKHNSSQSTSQDGTSKTKPTDAKATIAHLQPAVSEQHVIGDIPSIVTSENSQTLYVSTEKNSGYLDVTSNASLHLGGFSFNEQQTTAAVTTLTKQLTNLGYKAVNATLPTVKYLFSSDKGSCQLSTYVSAPQNTTVKIDVLCADASSYKSTIADRLSLLKSASVAKDGFGYTQTNKVAAGDQEAMLISVFSKDGTLSGDYVYGNQGDSWQYVGNSATGTPVEGASSEKFTINAQIQQGMKNAQYGKAVAVLVGVKL